MNQTDRAWAEISLEHLADNYRLIRKGLAPNCRLLACVKANAYGHGAIKIATALEALGADYFAVASLDEALNLRQANITSPILIFGHTPAEHTGALITENITQAVYSLAYAEELSHALSKTKQTLSVHLELETGLGRLGFPAITEVPHDAKAALCLPYLDFEGVYTHFSVADMNETYTKLQAARFQTAVAYLEDTCNHRFHIKHLAGSAGLLQSQDLHFDMVRPGLALYGISPNPSMFPVPLKPLMSLKARIMQVRDCAEDEFVSYGKTHLAKKGDTLAVLHLGYADGIPRILSGQMKVLVHGQKAPQVGRICMDMIVIDVSKIPNVQMGDIVTVFGKDKGKQICVSELAEKAQTIPYEVLCGIAPRVIRVYK